jgi:hypothetical protein
MRLLLQVDLSLRDADPSGIMPRIRRETLAGLQGFPNR